MPLVDIDLTLYTNKLRFAKPFGFVVSLQMSRID